MKKKLAVWSGIILGLTPAVVLAQGLTTGNNASGCTAPGNTGTLITLLCRIGQIFNAVVPVLIALGVVYFIWGVVQYVISDDEEAKSAGRNRMIFGIIGLAVIIGLWGLVNILRNTFGVDNNTTITIPTIPVVTGQ